MTDPELDPAKLRSKPMTTRATRSGLTVESVANDRDRPIGQRIAILRAWRDEIDKAERRLLMQLGCDIAKDLFARGIKPTGRPLGETFAGMDALPPRIEE